VGHPHGDDHRHAHAVGHPHGDDHRHAHAEGHPHSHSHGQEPPRRRLLAIVVPFGAAASPDLTILPVFLAATTAGAATAIGALAVFAAVTIATMLSLTVFAALGGYQIQGHWLDRWGNLFTAAILVVIGALVGTGVL
jgi:hypothetical protein